MLWNLCLLTGLFLKLSKKILDFAVQRSWMELCFHVYEFVYLPLLEALLLDHRFGSDWGWWVHWPVQSAAAYWVLRLWHPPVQEWKTTTQSTILLHKYQVNWHEIKIMLHCSLQRLQNSPWPPKCTGWFLSAVCEEICLQVSGGRCYTTVQDLSVTDIFCFMTRTEEK